MRKIIFISFLVVAALCCSNLINAQEENCKSERDSIQQLYYDALGILDSVMGKNIELRKELDQLNSNYTASKTEIKSLLKEKNDSAAASVKAKKTISDQMATIEKLEAEVKRLSQSKKTQ